MLIDNRFIIVSGTSRNVGKTTLACRIIDYFTSRKRNIISAKFITLKEGKDKFIHQHHTNIDTFEIFKEENLEQNKDTSKMLAAGSIASYLIVSKEIYVSNAIKKFLEKIPKDTFVIVESASLRNYIKPLAFIVVDRENIQDKKPYVKDLMPFANFIIDNAMEEGLCEKIFEI